MAITRIKNNQITDATITNVKILSQTLTGDLMNPNLTFNSNLVLNGNLTVTGNVTAVQSTTTQITDPLLTLGLGNAGTSYDLGLVLIRGSGGNRFIGFKENEGAFVFINTTEDGLTTGNIATTAYSNVIFGNATTIGSSTFGGITLSGNTISASGILTVRSDAGTVTIPNATIISSTLSVSGITTVDSLKSNAGIIATTGSFSSNLTASALTVNTSAVVGTTLQAVAGIQNTAIGNVTASTGAFTTLDATGAITGATTLTTTGTATLNALNVNNAATAGTTLTVGGTATVNALVSNGSIQGTTLNGSGNAIVNALTVNNSATVGGTLGVTSNISGSSITLTGSLVATGPGDFDGGLQSTPIGNAAPSTALFTTVGASSNATVAALTVNGTATFGSTVGITGTLTGAAAQFTTINGSGTATLNALNVNNAATAGTTLTVGGTATVNALVSNTTFTAASGTILGNLLVEGNLAVLGNLSYINVDSFTVEDPIIQLNTGPNGAPLSVANNFDAGVSTNYYDTADRKTFFGRKDSSGFFEYFSNVASETGNVITGTYGTIKSGNLELVSAATVGTTLSVVGNATVNALTVNASAVVGTTLQAVAGVQATPIGNVTASTGNFTTVGATGTATVNVLVSNGAVSGTTAQFTTVNGSANATVNALTVNGSAVVGTTLQAVAGVQATPIGNATASTGAFTTLDATGAITGATTLTTTGTATVNALAVNNAATINTTLVTGGTATVNALISNGAIQGTTLSGSGNATVAALTVNASAVVGTTLQAVAGVQATPIGNVTAASGAFTTLTSSGLTTFTNATDSTGPTSGAVVITGGLAVGKDLNVTTEANIGNVTINNLTITSNITNQGLNINPNGTGVTTINSGLNTSRTVINGTAANTLVVSGTQVGVNTSSFIGGATFQVNALDSILLPVGAIGDRPGSPAAGMLRFSTSQGSIEWYTGSSWAIPTGDFTVVVANSQTGNGSATLFTLPVANASTAGTIVSINGVVQQPTSAYSITGANVTFTEAPASTDVIDFRVFTTTASITAITDIAGNTGLFYDLPSAASQITTFKTAGAESFSIQANNTARFTGNAEPSANITYNLGSTTNRWKDLWLSGSTIYLGNIQIQNTTGNTVSFVTSTGAPADLNVDISDPSGIQGTPIGNATASSGNFTTIGATGALTVNSLNGVTAIVNGGTDGTGNIGASGATFNTVFAKATTAQYADLAENYSGDAVYEPGTVVHFGGSQEVTLCDEDMCSRVAGVVSTNPAYLMNSHLQGIATPVALQGRVPCKVRGPVSKGDMMVSAGAGYARAEANPILGSVIGKALADFTGTEGTIEVVVGRV